MTTGTKFELHQRVSRPINIYAQAIRLKYGVVTRIFSRMGTIFGDYPELYEVLWDNGKVGKAYLPHGITAV